MRIITICLCAALAACAGKPVRDNPVPVNIPVAAPCALPRPTAPMPLAQTYPHWASMDVKQKAAAVSKQALNWQTYAQQLHAATAACL